MTDADQRPDAHVQPDRDFPGTGAEEHHAEHDFTGPLSPGVKRFIQVFVSIAVVLALADFVVDRSHHEAEGAPHSYIHIDQWPVFYAVYGFIGCVVLVLVAKEMRKVVMRDESYYDANDGGKR